MQTDPYSTPSKAVSEETSSTAPVNLAPTSCSRADDPDDLQVQLSNISQRYGLNIINTENGAVLNAAAIAANAAAKLTIVFREYDSRFYRWDADEGLWLYIPRRSLMAMLSRFVKTVVDEAKQPSLMVKATPAFIKGVMQMMEGIAEFGEPASNYSAVIPVKKGVLVLSGEVPVLRDSQPKDWFTVKSPYAYDPDAKCDRFLKELLEPALGSQENVSFLQRDLGRMLVAGNFAQIISIIIGLGGSGKSVLIAILEQIIGFVLFAYLRSSQLTGRFETHGFLGKSILVGKDVAPDYLSNDGASVVKSLTGADRLQVEQKFGGKHDLRGSFYIIITTNSRLKVKLQGDLSAWRRRLVVHEFSRKAPEKRIPNFDQVLLDEEGSGILNWLVQGFLAHRQELREHGTLKLTVEQQQRVDDWLMESDALRAFATASISAGTGTITVEEVWNAFCTFARKRQWRLPRKQRFQEDFPEVMFELFGVERDNHIRRFGVEVRGYRGVQLNAEEVRP